MADRPYHPQEIEPKWQRFWEEQETFKVTAAPGKPKYYLLEMLPYPSGRIHMGHVRNYTIGDVAARFRMMRGFKVLHPMGWDAFGMPAENAAIKHGVHPAKWTYENIDYMRGQLKRLGLSYDWDREFATCNADYYRWEQLIFTRMFERGWAYKKTSQVNWCPTCQTVLANEQAEGGVCWRCDSPVVLQSMSQWYFKTTDYAEELLRDIDDKLTGWPERVRIMQREWIGKSVGANIEFQIEGRNDRITIFTTRPDTLYGATFMSLAWEHPLVREMAKLHGRETELNEFITRASSIDHQSRLAGSYEKEGFFTGAYCTNPVTGFKMPIYAANFVLLDYGTGAVMAVPAHDQRDFEFAKKYGLTIKVVIQPDGEKLDAATMKAAWEEDGVLVESAEFSGKRTEEAKIAITKMLSEKGLGKQSITYRLKDWCLSRQRYWGAPIPIIYCESCGAVPVPEKDLPVVLPQDVAFTGEGGSPLAKVASFIEAPCPKCGGKGRRETDTMDTFVESSWYMFRYATPHCDQGPLEPKEVAYWLPVDQYIGGIEHAVGHLIYCRYFTKVMRDLGFVKVDEPVRDLMTQGMVYKDGAKMSKSKGNVVDPDEMIQRYGADTVRLFMLFAAPPEKDLEWSDQGIEGSNRFIWRLWRLLDGWCEASTSSATMTEEMERWLHKTIKRVTEDIDRFHFNTAIAGIMEFLNYLYSVEIQSIPRDVIEKLILIVSPFAPHLSEELWRHAGKKTSTLLESWPTFDESKIASSTVTVVVQICGKIRDRIEAPTAASEEVLTNLALASEKVQQALEGKTPRKVIVVPGKLVNIVA